MTKIPEFIPYTEYYEKFHMEFLMGNLFQNTDECFETQKINGEIMVKIVESSILDIEDLVTDFKYDGLCPEIIITDPHEYKEK